jgi:hypothetical protein
MKEVIERLLEAPDTQIDASMKPLLRKWSDPPTPIQILEVLDRCIFSSLASGFVIQVLQLLYDGSCTANGTTHEEVVKEAYWRNER